MLIVSLCFEADPLTKLLAMWPFKWFSDHSISYEIYILQGCVWTVLYNLILYKKGWNNQPNPADVTSFFILYIIALHMASIFICLFITEPNGAPPVPPKKPAPAPLVQLELAHSGAKLSHSKFPIEPV